MRIFRRPLNWAVAVGKDSKYEKLADLKGEKIGISRIGRWGSVDLYSLARNRTNLRRALQW